MTSCYFKRYVMSPATSLVNKGWFQICPLVGLVSDRAFVVRYSSWITGRPENQRKTDLCRYRNEPDGYMALSRNTNVCGLGTGRLSLTFKLCWWGLSEGDLLQVVRPLDSLLTGHSCSLSALTKTLSHWEPQRRFLLLLSFSSKFSSSLTRPPLILCSTCDEPTGGLFLFKPLWLYSRWNVAGSKAGDILLKLKMRTESSDPAGRTDTTISILQDWPRKHWYQTLNYIYVWKTVPFSVQLVDFNMHFYHFAVWKKSYSVIPVCVMLG